MMDDLFPTLSLHNSFIHTQNNYNDQVNMDIYP